MGSKQSILDKPKSGYTIEYTECRDFFAVDNDLLELEFKRLGIVNPRYLAIQVKFSSHDAKRSCSGSSSVPLFFKDGIELELMQLDLLDIPGDREPLRKFLDPKYNPLVKVDFSKVRSSSARLVMISQTSMDVDGLETTTTYVPENEKNNLGIVKI